MPLENPMLTSFLMTGFAGLLMLTGPATSAELPAEAKLDLEPAINGAVSANGLFPTQPMEREFAAYLDWTKDQGLSRLAAFETRVDGHACASGPVANARMKEQFADYMRWVDDREVSPFYAFMVTDFD
jgi:hypothetical protein